MSIPHLLEAREFRINGQRVPLVKLAQAWVEKQERERLRADQRTRSRRYGIAVIEGFGSLTIPARLARMGAKEGDFADRVHYRYPVWLTVSPDNITPEQLGQVRNAPARFAQFGDRYDRQSRARVQERITRALRRFQIGEFAKEGDGKTWEVPILKIDKKRQIVYGVVYTPTDPHQVSGADLDAQGDFASPEEIERFSHQFLRDSRSYDLHHKELLPPEMAYVVESYLAPIDLELGGKKIKKGSWIVATYIPDPDLWAQVEKGEINAYSIRGWGKREPVVVT